MNLLGYLRSLYTFLTLSLASRFHSFTRRSGIAQMVVVGVIIAIIIVGGVVIYIVVTSSGATTTTTLPYP